MNRYLKSILNFLIISAVLVFLFAGVFYAGLRIFFIKREVVLPDFTGKQLYLAQKEAQDIGCSLYIADLEYTRDMDAGIVVSQRIDPGTAVARDRSIPVKVSLGPEKAFLSDYTGQSYYEAVNNLRMKGFTPGEITEVYSSAFYSNQVISQNPASGSEVHKKTPVDLLVSKGRKSRRYILPDLIGKDFFEVQYILDSMNVYIDEINYKDVKGFPEDIVVNQYPLGGILIYEGEYVSLTLNKRGARDYVRQKYLFELLWAPPGIIDYRIELRRKKGKKEESVWEKSLTPGMNHALMISGFKGDSFSLYLNGRLYKEYTIK